MTSTQDTWKYSWSGRLTITCELCCCDCKEVVHNHIDCPICNIKQAATNIYYELSKEINCTIVCECGAKFQTDEEPYDLNTIWKCSLTEKI